MTEPTTKLKVFVVEDEAMIAMVLEDAIEMLGYQIVGPIARLDEALILATNGEFDCAILDVNIRGGDSYPIAELLLKRGCPFIFTTGYSRWCLPDHLAEHRRLTKPYATSDLANELQRLRDQVESRRQKR